MFLFLALGIFWMNFLFFGEDSNEGTVIPPGILEEQEKNVEIGLEKLENQILGQLEFFESIVPTQERIGRDNPFAQILPVED